LIELLLEIALFPNIKSKIIKKVIISNIN